MASDLEARKPFSYEVGGTVQRFLFTMMSALIFILRQASFQHLFLVDG